MGGEVWMTIGSIQDGVFDGFCCLKMEITVIDGRYCWLVCSCTI